MLIFHQLFLAFAVLSGPMCLRSRDAEAFGLHASNRRVEQILSFLLAQPTMM